MTSRKLALWAGLLALGLAGSAQATLVSRLGGLAYYDTSANLTWLANANANGLMNWSTAMSWAAGLTIDGVTGWRLPTTDTSCSGYNCTGSEMGNLFYNVLGGTAGTNLATSHNTNYNLFSNIQSANYWSATEYAPFTGNAWDFRMSEGFQEINVKTINLYAWAVHTGDVSAGVPEPGTVWLMGIGLVGLLALRRRRMALR